MSSNGKVKKERKRNPKVKPPNNIAFSVFNHLCFLITV